MHYIIVHKQYYSTITTIVKQCHTNGIQTYNRHMEWHDWITKKYIEWRADRVGPGTSISAFGKQFEVKPSVISDWMKPAGTIPRKPEFINKLVGKYGTEVYSVLGMSIPAPVSDIEFSSLPKPLQGRLRAAINEVNQEITRLHLDPDTDEAETLTIQIFIKHGFKYTNTDIVPD